MKSKAPSSRRELFLFFRRKMYNFMNGRKTAAGREILTPNNPTND